MYCSFPFKGYAAVSIFFSTTYILTTYLFCVVFIRDVRSADVSPATRGLSICGLLSLAVSSIGPFALAWMMATHSGTIFQQRDAVYTFLHFQYNGFFTLAILALFFHTKYRSPSKGLAARVRLFSVLICLSIIPSLFLSLLWHAHNQSLIRPLAYLGCLLVLLAVAGFIALLPRLRREWKPGSRMADALLLFALVSFFIKMVLQTGTIFPDLGNAVFGFRPVIIGYLHLIFLGMLSFYLLSLYVEDGFLPESKAFVRFSLVYFSAMIILHELILLVNGVQLLRGKPHPVYGWLVWYAALGLLTGGILLALSRSKRFRVHQNLSSHPSSLAQ
jgi:hypothetical protein